MLTRTTLYSNLRALDKAGCEQILVQDVPSEEKWTAIRDRLARGAAVGAASETDQFAETGGYSVLPCSRSRPWPFPGSSLESWC